MRGTSGLALCSAAELFDEVNILLHRLVAFHAFELGPGFVLGGADEIEETGLGTRNIAFRSLLEQRE